MSRFTILGSALALALAGAAGCAQPESATSLVPEGPPMVRQVFMTETLIDATGLSRQVNAIAFGDHPDFDPTDDRTVTAAALSATNHIRIVVDELLIGNNLEQISCRDGSFQSVPEGTTPDDIAKCAVADDLLASSCSGAHAVCLDTTGAPIGVQDEVPTGGDGAADDTQFMPNIVTVSCHNDDVNQDIDVPLDIANSFWQPAGNQQVPAAGGFNSVGPAIILVTTQGMPSNAACTIDIDDSVVDKDHHAICAPPMGGFVGDAIDPSVDCPDGLDGGNTDLIVWSTEPLRVPLNSTFPANNATNVPHTSAGGPDARITIKYNADLSAADVAGFTLMEGSTERTDITAALDPNDTKQLLVTVPGGYLASTTYMLTIGAGSASDVFGIPMPASQESTITFTSAP